MKCVKIIGQRGADVIPEDAFTYHSKTRAATDRFCKDIGYGLREGGTVTYAALQVPYFLGFQGVVIVGSIARANRTSRAE
jgi:hypothetical protein